MFMATTLQNRKNPLKLLLQALLQKCYLDEEYWSKNPKIFQNSLEISVKELILVKLQLKAVIYYEKEFYLRCCRGCRSDSGRRSIFREVAGSQAVLLNMNFFKHIFKFCLDFKEFLVTKYFLFGICPYDVIEVSCKFISNSFFFKIQLKI